MPCSDEIRILSLLEAISNYPDYILYLTPKKDKLKDIRNYLIDAGIPEQRIRYLEPVEWYRGCNELNNFIRVSGFRMFTCCYLAAQRGCLSTPFERDLKTTLDKHTKVVTETIEKLKNNVPCVCDNCPSLYYGFWDKEPNYTTLVLDGWFKDDICNVSCIYCGQIQKDKCNENLTLLDAAKELATLLPNINRWLYTGGEPSAYPRKKELFSLVTEQKWMLIEAFTNAVIYDDFFANKAVSRGRINCSLDAGNRETYMQIKKIDYFDTVICNLKKYSKSGCEITLKYILLEDINDDPENIHSFINIAKCIGAKASLSFDQDAKTIITKDTSMWQSVKLFIRLAKKNDLKIDVEFWPLNSQEIQEIKDML